LVSEAPELLQQVHAFIDAWDNECAFEFLSSGSTGIPQVYRFDKTQLLSSAKSSVKALNLNQQTSALVCLPLSSVGGLMQLARAKVAGYELWIDLPSSRPLQNFKLPINFISLVPTQLSESLKFDVQKLKNIPQILIGGAPLELELIQACLDQNIKLIQSYGMTETLSHVALRTINSFEFYPFEALEGIHFEQENNCLIIAYPQLQKEPIRTNDLVRLIDPTHFEWLGRADFAIITGGVKVLPELIEQKMRSLLKQPFFVTGVPDEKWGHVVGLVVEGEPVDLDFSWEKFGLQVAEKPKKYVFITEFIRSNTLKILRQATLASVRNEDWGSI
jgi:O-succinylbenzoic acid--CoA ligase